ncbi:probable glycosyltransferase At5g03795 [Corylus avellana]|uniref:probable glycosyltransferase At5g03795 n=1 Tax=Corylus avellana TaxID=13451 RepID=UPI00286C8D3A|nr:probable glycosyltransferase At5g03795 [Corylus avellana]
MARTNSLSATIFNHLPYRLRTIIILYLRFRRICNRIILAVFLFLIYKFLHRAFAGIASSSEEVFRFPETRFAYERMETYLKIYIYRDRDPGANFQSPRELTGMYGSEAYFFKNIKESGFLTTNPLKAHLFFIPISWHQMRTEGTSYEKMITIVENYLESIISKYPYWNRTDGANHFFMICHDIGLEVTDGVTIFTKNLVRLVCPATYHTHSLPFGDIPLPPVNQSFSHPPGGNALPQVNRTRIDPWAGIPNSLIRASLEEQWKDVTELESERVWNDTAEGYLLLHDKIHRTKFCICPHGFPANTALIADSIRYGCIPVIFTNYTDYPFADTLDWKKFSIILDKDDVNQLKDTLKGIREADFTVMQNNLNQVQKHFQWNSPPLRFDAFNMVLYDLTVLANV